MKRFLKILFLLMWILLIAGAGVLIGFVEAEQYDRPCRKINISIDYGKADLLITTQDVDSLIRRTNGNLAGKPLGWVNTARIENTIRQQPYIERVKVYTNNKADVFIEIRQREPVLRVINKKFESFYLDGSGTLLPLNPRFPARVLVANGNINDSYINNKNRRINVLALSDSVYADSLLTRLYKLAMFISRDKDLKNRIDQIYVNEEGEFELIPRLGAHVILLGDIEGMEEKFTKLRLFYTHGLEKIGWNKYHVINIKFKNQVVCSKL